MFLEEDYRDSVKLINGTKTSFAIAISTFHLLEKLRAADYQAFYDLVDICRGTNRFEISAKSKAVLDKWTLTTNGRVLDETKKVVIASAVGEGFNIKVVDPVAD